MADPIIKIKRSAVPGKIPNTTTLPVGEFAINTYDGKVYIQQDQGAVGVGSTVIVVNPWSVGLGSTSYNTYFTAGKVGVGTTRPTEALTVVGVVSATSFVGDGSGLTNIAVTAKAVVAIAETAPSNPEAGDLWYNSLLGRTFVYYNDGSSSQWVDTAPFNVSSTGGSGATVSVGATAPSGPAQGDLWYNTNYGRTFVYFRDGDSDQWVDASPFTFQAFDEPTKNENSFTATNGQTTFSVTYNVGYIEVYLNGIRLSESEYNATTGSSVVLNEAAKSGDVLDVVEISTGRGPTGPQGPAGPLTGIGSTSAAITHYPIIVKGTGDQDAYITTTSSYFSFIPSSGTLTTNQLNIVGVVTATDFNSSSDINLKTNVKNIDDSLSKVMQLNGVSFDWNDTQQSSAGVIAQDVEKVLPEIVHENSTGYKSVNYNGLIGLLIEAVKEQNKTIELLTEKINTLEERLS